MELVALFYLVDEFCKSFEPAYKAQLVASGEAIRNKPSSLSLSEILTIMIHFHQSNHKTFKHYYTDYVSVYLDSDFPGLVSYGRFIELMTGAIIPLFALLVSLLRAATTANYIDSTKLPLCHNPRLQSNKVFNAPANRPKS